MSINPIVASFRGNTGNDPVFNADVAEFFVAPHMEQDPHCYNELGQLFLKSNAFSFLVLISIIFLGSDISPFNVQYDAGIYNKNLNHSGIVGYDFACDGSGIEHATVVNSQEKYWKATMSYSFELLNCPFNCPLKQYCGHSTPNNVYRANFFRISELTATSQCTSSTCEYMVCLAPTISAE